MSAPSGPSPPGRIPHFWLLAALIVSLGAALMVHDIDRPFYGMHSVDQAHNAWLARSHVVYGLGYTHGYPTFEVGYPPTGPPARYLDHPVGYVLMNAGSMAVLGVNNWSLRLANVVWTAVAILLFVRIVRGLSGDATALLSGFVLAQLPLVTYFGLDQWLYPLLLTAYWCYLVLLEAIDEGPAPSWLHGAGLAAALFVAVQIRWQAAFFAAAIGLHYAARCLRRRQPIRPGLLAAVVVPSVAGTLLDVVILAAGDGWNFTRIVELFGWRSGAGEREVHAWGPWFARLGEFGVTNFTWVVLGLVAFYALVAAVAALRRGDATASAGRRFPWFSLFLVPGLLQLFVLKGTLWEHQWWERPLTLPIAVAVALAVLTVGDLLRRVHPRFGQAGIAVLMVAISVSTYLGTSHYFDLRYYYEERLEMFEALQAEIPPDQALLSFESYNFDQKPGVKQGSYRPEVGWHLNREIVVARLLPEILDHARSGEYSFYLMPATHRKPEVNQYLAGLRGQLEGRYPARVVRGNPDQWVFDLRGGVGPDR